MPSEKSKDKSKDKAIKEEGAKKSSKKASGGDLTSSSPKRSSSSAGGKEKSAKTAEKKAPEQPVPAATTVKKAKAEGGVAATTGGGGDGSPTSATTKKKKKAAESNDDASPPPPQVYQPAQQQQQQPELYQPASQPSSNQQDQRQQQQQQQGYDAEYYDEEGYDYSGGAEQYGQQQQQQQPQAQQQQEQQQQEFPNLPLPEDMKAAAAAERQKKEAADQQQQQEQQQQQQQQNQEQPPPAASATTAPPPSTTGSSFMFGGGADNAKDTTGGSTTATAAHQPQSETKEADAAGAAGSTARKEPAGNSSAVGGDHQQETKANDTVKQQPASNAVDDHASPSSPLSTSSRADSKKKISLKTAGNTVGAALEIKKKWRQKIDAYCMVRVPSMTASDIDAAFEHYGQKENGYEKMWASLTKRFGPELTPLEKERIMWSRKVKNYYALVDPAKTDEDVEKCLQHFERKENGYEIMWSRLQKRYGVTIPDAGSPEKNAPASAAAGGGGLSAAALAAQNARAASPHHTTIRRKSSSPSGRPTMAPLENPLVAAHLAEDAASHLHVPPPPVEVVQPRVILLVVVAGVSMKLYKNAGPAQQFKFNSAVALEVQRLLRFPENIVVTKVADYHYANVHVSPHGEVEAGGGILFELETALPTGWSASIVGSTLIGKVLSGGATCAMIRQAYAEELLGNPQRVYIMDAGVVEVRSTPGLRAMLNLSTSASPLASADDQQYLRRGAGGIGTQATVEGGTFVVPKPPRNVSPFQHYDDQPTHSQHGYNAQVPPPAPSDRYNAGRLSPRHDAELLQSQLTSASPPANPFATGVAHHQQQLVVSTTGQHPPAVSGGSIDARRRVPAPNDGIPPTAAAEYEPHTPSPVAQNVQRHNPLPTSPTNNGGSGGSRYYDLQGTAATGLQQPAFFGGGTPGGSKAFASPYNRTTVPSAATMNNSPQFDTVTPAPQQAPNQAAAVPPSQGSFRPQDVNTTTYLDPLTISPIAPGGANNNTGGGDVTMHQGTTALSPDVGGSRSAMAAHLRRSGTF